jgi:predicted NAD/FAD-binding protein
MKVPVATTNMSFAVTRDEGAFEWGGDTLVSLFCQPRNILKGSMWRMIWDILRFNASARRLLVQTEAEPAGADTKAMQDAKQVSVGEYLREHGYSESFRDNYLLVSIGCISLSCPNDALSPWQPPSGPHRRASAQKVFAILIVIAHVLTIG